MVCGVSGEWDSWGSFNASSRRLYSHIHPNQNFSNYFLFSVLTYNFGYLKCLGSQYSSGMLPSTRTCYIYPSVPIKDLCLSSLLLKKKKQHSFKSQSEYVQAKLELLATCSVQLIWYISCFMYTGALNICALHRLCCLI